MKLYKYISVLALVILNACSDSGNSDTSTSPPESQIPSPDGGGQTPGDGGGQNPGKEDKLYFEKQTDMNCALHSVNNAFGASFLPSEHYDRYISLTVAQKTGNIPDDGAFYLGGLFLGQYRFTAAQQQALRRYYDPNTPGTRDAKRKALAQNFDAHQDGESAIDWATFAQDMGIFGGVKAIQFVLPVVDQLYDLKLDLNHYFKDLKSEIAQPPQELVNAERLILTTGPQGGHFYAMRKFNGVWYLLDSGNSGPQPLTGSHLDWATTLAPSGTLVKYFTASEEARIKAAAKSHSLAHP